MQATALLLAAPQCCSSESQRIFPLHHGLTPLHLAAAENDIRLAALLLKEQPHDGSHQNARCLNCPRSAAGFTYSSQAHPCLPAPSAVRVQLPLCPRCLANAPDNRGRTAAFYCCSHKMLRLLLDSGARIDSLSNTGDTLLHAVVYNARRSVRPVTEYTGEAFTKSEESTEAECMSCSCAECAEDDGSGVPAICRIVLLLQRMRLASSTCSNEEEYIQPSEMQEFINKRNMAGWTALHVAASRGYSDVCRVRELEQCIH